MYTKYTPGSCISTMQSRNYHSNKWLDQQGKYSDNLVSNTPPSQKCQEKSAENLLNPCKTICYKRQKNSFHLWHTDCNRESTKGSLEIKVKTYFFRRREKMKKTITAITLAMMITFGSVFASAQTAAPAPTGGIIIEGITGIIIEGVAAFAGIIIEG
jgi:hypothetical protein